MMTNTELIADTLDKTRMLTKHFLSKLVDVDPYKKTVFGGMEFNSIYWIAAHLTWAEHNLIIKCSGGELMDLEQVNHYLRGSDGSLHESHIPFENILKKMDEVHEYCINYVKAKPDSWLEEENKLKFGMNGDTSNRFLLQHAIRHEGNHGGHLLWIGKMNELRLIK